MFKSLPTFDYARQQAIRKEFLALVTPDITQQGKADLQAQFTSAIDQAKKEVEKQRGSVAIENTQTFLANPKLAVEHLNETKGCFDLGEMLSIYGIGKVKAKRFGKGVMFAKGTLAEGTQSNFKVSASIGDHCLEQELCQYNDRELIDLLSSYVLGRLAMNLAAT